MSAERDINPTLALGLAGASIAAQLALYTLSGKVERAYGQDGAEAAAAQDEIDIALAAIARVKRRAKLLAVAERPEPL